MYMQAVEVSHVIARLEGARTVKEYREALRLADRLDRNGKFAIVDAAIDAHFRVNSATGAVL